MEIVNQKNKEEEKIEHAKKKGRPAKKVSDLK